MDEKNADESPIGSLPVVACAAAVGGVGGFASKTVYGVSNTF